MNDDSDEIELVNVHAKVPEKLRDEFKATGLNYSVWLPKEMEDEIYRQKKLRELKRKSVHQMGSQGVSKSPGQTHPDHKQTDTDKQENK